MNENEAINELKFFMNKLRNGIFGERIGCFNVAIKAIEEIQKYRAIGTIEDFQKSADVRKRVTEIVNRQLIASKNNFKETYYCFLEIVKVVQDNY